MKRRRVLLMVLLLLPVLLACQHDSPPESSLHAAAAGTEPARIEPRVSAGAHPYVNYCRVTGTPEEVILDFGLNPQPYGEPASGIEVDQRIVVSYYTAKRMLGALQQTVQRHEDAFGTLELDPRKRVKK